MTAPENPQGSGQQADPEQTSVIKQEPDAAGGERTPSPVSRPESGQPAAQSDSAAEPSAQDVADSDAATVTNPPPWQRVPAEMASNGSADNHGGGYRSEPVAGLGEPPASPSPLSSLSGAAAADHSGSVATAVSPNRAAPSYTGTQSRPGTGSASTASATAASARRPGRGPRRASLQVKRVDPWSVLKLALVLSVALFFVWLVAVGVLYGVLSGMGVWDKLNGTYNELTQAGATSGDQLISAGRVFGIAAIIGAVNIVLFTALATLAAFIYNVSSDLVGGVEVTLSERE